MTTANIRSFLSPKVLEMLVCSFLLVLLLLAGEICAPICLCESIQKQEKTAVVAHRTGGYLASENSLEGLDEADSHGCYGGETDIQRTKDRHYIINHDNDFARLTGDPHKPSELSLEEIKQLKIRDTTGNGQLLPVPTLEELLDHGKGKVKLFLELKGESADYDMVEDVVKAVKERDVVDDVVLISLNYDVIKDRSSDLWFY